MIRFQRSGRKAFFGVVFGYWTSVYVVISPICLDWRLEQCYSLL